MSVVQCFQDSACAVVLLLLSRCRTKILVSNAVTEYFYMPVFVMVTVTLRVKGFWC